VLAATVSRAAPPGDAPAKEAAPAKEDAKAATPAAPAVPFPKLNLVIDVQKSPEAPEIVKLINSKIEEGWRANKITPAPFVDDYEFLRRASLDIIGRIAKPEEIKEYMRQPAEKRRSWLIDHLLDSEDYPRHWANLWSNWLLTRTGSFGRGMYKDQMAVWLEDQFAQNRPYSEIVQKVLTAKGKNTESGNGAVNFILAHVGEMVPPADRGEYGQFEMVPLTSRITRLFLGTQVQCAQCHDHPFYGSLKQEHFWGVNAFLRQVTREGTPPMIDSPRMTPGPLTLVDNPEANPSGKVPFEKRNGVILKTRAVFLPAGGEDSEKGQKLDMSPGAPSRREQMARFLIDHPNFPRAIVNRMWGNFFGRGFVNPVDDFNDNNQPSNPELLTELGARFKHYDYDQKKLIRWLCNSNAYNLSCVANRTNDKAEHEVLFSRMILKALSPEQLFESLMVATNAEAAENRQDKAKLRDQWLNRLIGGFGDDEGNEVNFNGTVVQALMMMNGEDINSAITRPNKGTVALAIARGRTAAGIIHELYLASLNRPPTQREMTAIMTRLPLRVQFQVKDASNPSAKFEDVFWALLNSSEFILNH